MKNKLLAFAHTQGEAGTPREGIWNAVVGWTGPFLCAEEVGSHQRFRHDVDSTSTSEEALCGRLTVREKALEHDHDLERGIKHVKPTA
jgi:hypothetical protein